MKKVLIIFSLLCILCSCEMDQMKMETCSYIDKDVQSEVKLTAYHSNEEIAKIIVELRKSFDVETIKKLGSERIERSVRNSLVSTIGEEAQMEFEYDDKSRTIYAKITMFTEEMNESALESFNLSESKEVKEFIEYFESLDYTCKSVTE